jgi:dihydrofolate reductase
LIIIAALNRKRVIGKNGSIPWHIPEDLKRLKRLTTGHTLLMGRRTYESLQTPLPNRRHVVVTSRSIAGVETYATIPDALRAVQDQEKVFVFGGGEIFAATLEKADEWYLTLVEKSAVTRSSLPTNISSGTSFSSLQGKSTKDIHSWITGR